MTLKLFYLVDQKLMLSAVAKKDVSSKRDQLTNFVFFIKIFNTGICERNNNPDQFFFLMQYPDQFFS